MKLKLIYKARDITEAHILSGLLRSEGIDSYVGGHYLQGGVGELAAMDFATISVADEDSESALTIIAEYEKNTQSEVPADGDKSIFWFALIMLALSVISILLLAMLFSSR